MCVAIAVVAGIGVAGSITAAKMQSNAAHDAAATQSASANKALTVQQQQYQQGRQDFSPYQQAGASAVGTLQNRAQQPIPQFNPGGPQPQFNLGSPQGPSPLPQRGPMGGSPMSQAGPLDVQQSLTPIPNAQAGPMPQQSTLPQQGPPQQPQMVMMQAPDGSKQPVPADKVPMAIQKGARVVNA